jgi:hypothetical protein
MIYTTTNPDGTAGEPMVAYMPYPGNGQQMPPGGILLYSILFYYSTSHFLRNFI